MRLLKFAAIDIGTIRILKNRVRGIEYMNPDRADGIIPAALIFMKVMKGSDAKSILVPRFGVADGIVCQLDPNYKEHTDA